LASANRDFEMVGKALSASIVDTPGLSPPRQVGHS
jgi:hypothetical protein